MRNPFDIVVVSSDLERRRYLADILARLGLDPICASTLRECNESLARESVGLVFCDAHVTDGNYQDLLNAYAGRKPRVVLISSGDHREVYSARQYGAFDVVSMPCLPTNVEWIVIQARRAASKEASDSPRHTGVENSLITRRQASQASAEQATSISKGPQQ